MALNNILKIVLSVAVIALAACQSDSSEPMLTTITRNGKAVLSNGESVPIPHYGDPAWSIFYLVRHCEKVQDGSDNPDLAPEGKERAQRLGKIMDDAVLHRIGTSNKKRCMKTASAVAKMAASPPFENFPPENSQDWALEKLDGGGGMNFFYCGHSNTVPALLNFFAGQSKYADLLDTEYGRFFVVATQGAGKSEVLEFKYK